MGHSQLPTGHVGVGHSVLSRPGVTGVREEGDEAVNEAVQLGGTGVVRAGAACSPRTLPVRPPPSPPPTAAGATMGLPGQSAACSKAPRPQGPGVAPKDLCSDPETPVPPVPSAALGAQEAVARAPSQAQHMVCEITLSAQTG